MQLIHDRHRATIMHDTRQNEQLLIIHHSLLLFSIHDINAYKQNRVSQEDKSDWKTLLKIHEIHLHFTYEFPSKFTYT